MSNYRRNLIPGGIYFFTVVTQGRRPILTTSCGRKALRVAFDRILSQWPFTPFVTALLPDHLRCFWILPPGDSVYSIRWRRIKEEFTRFYLENGGREAEISESRKRSGERGIWQRRFWEHTIRDETELKSCVDYIHWNPCKHHLVKRAVEWPWSTFHRFLRAGEYDASWGKSDPCPNLHTPEWDGA